MSNRTDLCGIPNLGNRFDDSKCRLARGHRSIKHLDQFDVEWTDAGQVSGDRPWRVREEGIVAKDEQLLSYCRSKDLSAPTSANSYGDNAVYQEIADKMAAILDGEK